MIKGQLTDTDRTEIVKYRLEKAYRTYNEAIGSIENGYVETAANRSATDGSDFPGNIYLLFQQLILLLTTTYKSFLRCLFLLKSSSHPHQ